MTPHDDTAAIRSVLEKVRQAHHDKDAVAVLAEYAPKAVVFDLAPPLRSAIGTNPKELQKWFDTWDGPVDVSSRDREIAVSGDIAVCHGLQCISAKTKATGEHAVFWVRATVCLRREAGTWRIIHEHTSVPFYMDGSFSAAIDLEP